VAAVRAGEVIPAALLAPEQVGIQELAVTTTLCPPQIVGVPQVVAVILRHMVGAAAVALG
jgi:hypothetical protein